MVNNFLGPGRIYGRTLPIRLPEDDQKRLIIGRPPFRFCTPECHDPTGGKNFLEHFYEGDVHARYVRRVKFLLAYSRLIR